MRNKLLTVGLIAVLSLTLNGCTFIIQRGRRSDVRKIEDLSRQLNDLALTKKILEERLSSEINDKQVKLQMAERGLVITFLADILFDSGKAKIKSEAHPILDKVARVLKENVPNLKVGIEGYTDNQPIRLSGWKSNWQLSTERALSVLYYLADKKGIAPERFSVIGYGEYQPVTSNASKEGRQLNRRVEVVIMPNLTKVKEQPAEKIKESEVLDTEENLK